LVKTPIYAAEEILKPLSITEGLIRKVLTASAKVIDATDDYFDGTTFKVKGFSQEGLALQAKLSKKHYRQ
jgi:hypothetical protein